jgi:Ca2+-binding RTX toxin-like protein
LVGSTSGAASNLFVGGGTAVNTLFGGAGTNVYYTTAADTIHAAGTSNIDVLLVDNVSLSLGSSGLDQVVLHGGANTVDATGATKSLILYGAGGNDTLFGGAGGGYLIGGGGSNDLHGGGAVGATDIFVGGNGGTNSMTGGAGANVYYTTTADTIHAAGTSNIDVLLTDNVSLALGASGLDEIVLHGGANTVDMAGATKSVQLYGAAGNDTLFGGAGNDYLWGREGTNTFGVHAGFGHDGILDWTAGTNNVLDLRDLAASDNVHSIADLDQSVSSGHLEITIGANSIAIFDQQTALTDSHFLFA